MSKQVLVVGPHGSITGLVHKKGGVDLRSLGRAEIERVTLIEWDSEEQGWYIRWYNRNHGALWRVTDLRCVPHEQREEIFVSLKTILKGGVPIFKEYEDAVRAEVLVIQNLQLNEGSVPKTDPHPE
jgi:hypothetical protein